MENLDAIARFLGGPRVLGRQPKSAVEFVQRVRQGLPSAAIDAVSARLDISDEELSRAVDWPRRTLVRRKGQARLQPRESECILRLARLGARAEEVLGTLPAAQRWLRTSNRSLGGQTPMDLADTDIGTELVLDVLGRLDLGVYA